MDRFMKATLVMVISFQLFSIDIIYGMGNDRKTFTLKEAVEMAITNNRLIKEAVESFNAAIEEEKVVKRDSLPKASASYSYSKLKDAPFAVFNVAPFPVGKRDNYHWDVTLQQPIFTGFALSTKRKMAKLGIKIKGEEREQVTG